MVVMRLTNILMMAALLCVGASMPCEADDSFGVHLASYRSVERAEEGWRILAGEYPDLLSALSHVAARADLGPEKGVYFRLMAGPLEAGEADELMADLRARGAECSVRSLDLAELAAPPTAYQVEAPSANSVQASVHQEGVHQEQIRTEQVAAIADSIVQQQALAEEDERPQRTVVPRLGKNEIPKDVREPESALTNPFSRDDESVLPKSDPVLAKIELDEGVRTEVGVLPALDPAKPAVETFTRMNIDTGPVILAPQLNLSTTGEVTPFAGFTIPF